MNPVKQPSDPSLIISSLPSYVDFPNDPIIPLPGLADHTMMYFFPIRAEYDNVLATCDKRLNFSAESYSRPTYKPIDIPFWGSPVFVMLSHMQKAFPLDKSYKKIGWLKETAVQIVIPVIKWYWNGEGELTEWPSLQLFIPYIFISNPMSLVIGREHIGFPKMMGKFNFPASPDNAAYFDVNVYGFKRFDDQNPQFADYFPWLTVRRKEDEPITSTGIWPDLQVAWDAIRHMLPSFDFTPSGTMVFLKQFRDIAQPHDACYQAINEADVQIQAWHGGYSLPGTFDVNFHDVASYPIVEELGLSATNTVSHAFWMNADLQFGTGRTIWQAPTR